MDMKSDLLVSFYTENYRFINYCFVCGVLGIGINQATLLTLSRYIPLYIANFAAIGFAMISNYTFTVGPLGYIFGQHGKPEKQEPEEKHEDD